jgi:hypothetical protein
MYVKKIDEFFNSAYTSFETWFIFYKTGLSIHNDKPSERDHDLPGTFGVAVSIPNHYAPFKV